MEHFICVCGLFLLVSEHFVLETILEKNLAFSWVRREALSELKLTTFTFENNLKNHWNLTVLKKFKCEIHRHIKIFTSARVAREINFRSSLIVFDFLGTKLDSTVELCSLWNFKVNSVLGGAVEDETEGSCEGTVELNFRLIFVPGSSVKVLVNERLHRVNEQDELYDFVLRI